MNSKRLQQLETVSVFFVFFGAKRMKDNGRGGDLPNTRRHSLSRKIQAEWRVGLALGSSNRRSEFM